MQPLVQGWRQWGARFWMLSPGSRIVLGLLGIVTAVTLGSALFGPGEDEEGERSAQRAMEGGDAAAVLAEPLPPLEVEDEIAPASVESSPRSVERARPAAGSGGTEALANRGMSLDAARR